MGSNSDIKYFMKKIWLILFGVIFLLSFNLKAKPVNLMCYFDNDVDEHFFVQLDLNKKYADIHIPLYLEDESLAKLKAIGIDINDFTKTEINKITSSIIDIKFYADISKGLQVYSQLQRPDSDTEEYKNFEETLKELINENLVTVREDGYAHLGNFLIYRNTLTAILTTAIINEVETAKSICKIEQNKI